MTQFQKSIEKVLKGHNKLEWFQTGQDFYLRLDQPNYDRLVIERHGEIIIVGHYFEQNGDLIADPEVELHYPDWTPVAITQLLIGRREKFIGRDSQTLVDKNFHRQVAPFLAMWGRNIDAQGWATRATRTSSRGLKNRLYSRFRMARCPFWMPGLSFYKEQICWHTIRPPNLTRLFHP